MALAITRTGTGASPQQAHLTRPHTPRPHPFRNIPSNPGHLFSGQHIELISVPSGPFLVNALHHLHSWVISPILPHREAILFRHKRTTHLRVYFEANSFDKEGGRTPPSKRLIIKQHTFRRGLA